MRRRVNIRSPNIEIRNNFEIRNMAMFKTCPPTGVKFQVRISGSERFELSSFSNIRICLEFRISSFELPARSLIRISFEFRVSNFVFSVVHESLREQELELEAQLPVRASVRPLGVIKGLELSVDRQPTFPMRQSFPKPPPTGTVHVLSLLASQLAVMMGALDRYQPSGRL